MLDQQLFELCVRMGVFGVGTQNMTQLLINLTSLFLANFEELLQSCDHR